MNKPNLKHISPFAPGKFVGNIVGGVTGGVGGFLKARREAKSRQKACGKFKRSQGPTQSNSHGSKN